MTEVCQVAAKHTTFVCEKWRKFQQVKLLTNKMFCPALTYENTDQVNIQPFCKVPNLQTFWTFILQDGEKFLWVHMLCQKRSVVLRINWTTNYRDPWCFEVILEIDTLELFQPFKGQPYKMVKNSQTILWQQPTNCLSVLTILWGWRLKC